MMRLLPAICFVIFACGSAPAEEAPAAATPALSLLRQLDEGFVEIFERVAPSVVVIEARKKPGDDSADEDWQRFFFQEGEESGRPPPKEGDRSRLWPLPPQTRSEGSGFLIRPDGHILTNFHVVADAEKLEVRLKDGRKFPARLVGADDKTDIAVIKIDGKELPVATFGDSDKLRVGQLVCAIGAPFNQDYSFTCGWVSGKGRTNLIGPSSPAILYEDYIQTDAFINPGNSGGPLFDVEGRVVGMNTLINGIGRGLAFAIPANMLQEVSTQLITVGRMQRPWIGIRMESLQTSPARERVLGVDKGVVVSTIEPNAPAYKSDLRPADVITEVDGVKLGTARELQKEILKKRVGQLLQLTVWRSGTVIRIPITTGELPTDLTRVANPLPKRVRDQIPRDIGLDLRDAEPAGAGALVMKVEPEGLASDAEIQATDMISEVDGKPVKDAATAMAAITSLRDQQKPVPLTVQRQGKRSLVILSGKK